MILFTCLTFNLVDGDNTIRAYDGAGSATDAVVIYGMGVVVTLAVYIFRQRDALHRAHGYTDSAAFAALGIDDDLSFKCHNFNVIRLI